MTPAGLEENNYRPYAFEIHIYYINYIHFYSNSIMRFLTSVSANISYQFMQVRNIPLMSHLDNVLISRVI